MVSRATKKLLLIGGGVAVLGYLLLRKTEEAVTGVAAPLFALPGAVAALPAEIQAGAAAFTGGIADVIGAAGTGAVGGVVESVAGGFEELTRPFPQPLRTYEPVPEVRQIPLEQQIGFTEQPVIPVEEYERVQAVAAIEKAPLEPRAQAAELFKLGEISMQELAQRLRISAPPVVELAAPVQPSGQFWVNPVTGATIIPYVAGVTPPSVLRLREQDIFPAIRRL